MNSPKEKALIITPTHQNPSQSPSHMFFLTPYSKFQKQLDDKKQNHSNSNQIPSKTLTIAGH